MAFLLVPILLGYFIVFGIVTSIIINSYLIPLFGLTETSNVSITGGVIIVMIITFIYFILFTKKVESDKFKWYRSRKRFKK